MKDERLIKDVLPNVGTDALLVMSPSNVLYFGGYNNPDCTILVTKNGIRYCTDKRYSHEASLVIPENYAIEAISCTDFDSISKWLKEQGCKTVAIDDIPYRLALSLQEKLGDIQIIEASSKIGKNRVIKSSCEVEYIAHACRCNDIAFESLLGQIKEGVTELELAYMLQYEYIKAGGEGIAFDTISVFGEHTACPHGHPGHTPLKLGDVITLDFGTKYKGYCSDITRSFCFGEPKDPDYKRCYQAVLKANRACIDYVQEGLTCTSADKLARDILGAEGLAEYFTHSLGHGVGIDIHEYPYLSPSSKDVFCNNMIYTIEPGIYINGRFGIRIEDSLCLIDGKPVTLTRCDKNLIIL